jgi:hypothetical protein
MVFPNVFVQIIDTILDNIQLKNFLDGITDAQNFEKIFISLFMDNFIGSHGETETDDIGMGEIVTKSCPKAFDGNFNLGNEGEIAENEGFFLFREFGPEILNV